MQLLIRNEVESDYRVVEDITREAFGNLYVPGCDEHYLTPLLSGKKLAKTAAPLFLQGKPPKVSRVNIKKESVA